MAKEIILTDEVQEDKVSRKEMEQAYSEFWEYQDELDAIEASKKAAKADIQKEYQEYLDEMEAKFDKVDSDKETDLKDSQAKLEAAEKILQKYISEKGGGTVVFPDTKGSFGYFEKKPAYIFEDEEKALETMQKFKDKFPNNHSNFLTGYPKFSVTKMRGLIANDFITEDELSEMGIMYSCEKSFEVKPPKK